MCLIKFCKPSWSDFSVVLRYFESAYIGVLVKFTIGLNEILGLRIFDELRKHGATLDMVY